jgi:hypothetical protein
MNAIDIEKLNQLISRTDMSGNDKVKWLVDFIDGKEFEQQERGYSKEDMKEAFNVGFNVGYNDETSPSYLTAEKFIEKFKKK